MGFGAIITRHGYPYLFERQAGSRFIWEFVVGAVKRAKQVWHLPKA